MLINKMGFEHIGRGTNCQDFGVEFENIKIVLDGCSGCKHSEVGAKLFAHFMQKAYNLFEHMFGVPYPVKEGIEEIFKNQLRPIFTTEDEVNDHMMFTVLVLEKTAEEYIVHYCGDGYIIKEKQDGTFEYESLGEGNTPPFYGYNFIDPRHLTLYKDGVQIHEARFPVADYKAIGISSDGLAYIINSPYKDEFEKHLRNRSQTGIKLMINRENNRARALYDGYIKRSLDEKPFVAFSDDITIAI